MMKTPNVKREVAIIDQTSMDPYVDNKDEETSKRNNDSKRVRRCGIKGPTQSIGSISPLPSNKTTIETSIGHSYDITTPLLDKKRQPSDLFNLTDKSATLVKKLRDSPLSQIQSNNICHNILSREKNTNYSTFTDNSNFVYTKDMRLESKSSDCTETGEESSSSNDSQHSCARPAHANRPQHTKSYNPLLSLRLFGRHKMLTASIKPANDCRVTMMAPQTTPSEPFLESSANRQQDANQTIRLDQYHKWVYESQGGISLAAFDLARQEGEGRQRALLKQRIQRSAIIGAIVGGLFAIILLKLFPNFPNDFRHLVDESKESLRIQEEPPSQSITRSGSFDMYLQRLFSRKRRKGSRRSLLSTDNSWSSSSSKNSDNSPLLVVAGKMTISGGPCNIAQFNLATGEWSLDERIQLSLYNSYSGGEVYSLLANYTSTPVSKIKADNNDFLSRAIGTSPGKKQSGSGELLVVGAFDTTYRNSQVTYCSVGMWNGEQLSKVGEGLCNSALSKGMKITTASLAGPQDVYVAGSFQTQVWSGDRNEFVKIFNIAHFNALEQVWLPLNVGQISCSWCTVTVLALAWDSKRRQLHIAGKFNAIDGRNVPAGLAIYDYDSGHLVAHPGGGLSMRNVSQDGVGTALQLDQDAGVLYVMGSFERLTQTYERCDGLAAFEIDANRWTCLADPAHTVYPTGGGNMLLTPFGLMVAGKTTPSTTWHDGEHPHTIALLKTTLQTTSVQNDPQSKDGNTSSTFRTMESNTTSSSSNNTNATLDQTYHKFNWSWLPGFKGHDEPLHALTNGFGYYEGSVFIAGDNLVARWSYQPASKYPEEEEESSHTESPDSSPVVYDENSTFPPFRLDDQVMDQEEQDMFNHILNDHGEDTLVDKNVTRRKLLTVDSLCSSGTSSSTATITPKLIPITEVYSADSVRGAIMAISQMMPEPLDEVSVDGNTIGPSGKQYNPLNVTIIVYCVTGGCVLGVLGAILCNRNISGALFQSRNQEKDFKGFSLDTLTYSAMQNTSMMDAYQRAMKTRHVQYPNLLTVIDPQEIFLQRIIGEGTFGRVWSAKWRSASVAVKEFVFAQAAVAGKSSQQQQIVEEIIGEAGMMSILRHPNVLQLFGCSLTAQAIWIVSELCSLGSLRQLLDDNDRVLPASLRLNLAIQVAEGMTYLHNQNPPIIHRDLKSHNIFVHETFTDIAEDTNNNSKRKDGSERIENQSVIVARIGDWGSARASLSGSRTMTHGVGTACWLAPEVIKHARSSKFSDVYGYGIVLWELATREEVYQGLETTQIIAKVANENLRPPVPQDCAWKDVMVKCWAENPLDRLEFAEIEKELNSVAKELDESTSGSPLDDVYTSSGGSDESIRSIERDSISLSGVSLLGD